MDGGELTRRTTARPQNVRVALQHDEQAIFAALMLLADENALSPVNDELVHAAIANALGRKGSVIGLIDAPDGSIAATIGITMTTWWYTRQWHCEELWSFVHPDHRRGKQTYAKDLIQFGRWWADQLGMDLLMGVLSTARTEGKVRLYRRSIPCVGALFLHRGGALN